MSVDIAKLRRLQKLYEDSKTAPPEAMVLNDVLGEVHANDRTYHACIFVNALLNAAPMLLSIAEAASDWAGWDGSDDTATLRAKLDTLHAAVDAARSKT